jgi:hypothetical protein
MNKSQQKLFNRNAINGELGGLRFGPELIMPMKAGISLPKLKAGSSIDLTHQRSLDQNSQSQTYAAREARTQRDTRKGGLPSIKSIDNLPAARKTYSRIPHESLSKEFSNKTKSGMDQKKFNLTLSSFDKLKDTLTERHFNKETSIPVTGSGLNIKRKKPDRFQAIADGYSKINFITVPDYDGPLLTQAREEKTRRGYKQVQKVGSRLQGRIEFIKKYFKNYDVFLADLGIGDTLKIELLVCHSNYDQVCLQKLTSTMKVIETYLTLYSFNFQNLASNLTDEMTTKIINRLKRFLWKSVHGAFEIKIEDREVFESFQQIQQSRRTYLHSDQFFLTQSIESMVLSYLFLEYKLTTNLRDFKHMMSQLSVKVDMMHDDEPKPEVKEEEGDLRTDEQKTKDEKVAKELQIKESLAQLRRQIMDGKQGVVDKEGQMGYFSKYLARIEVCLQNKDELFEIERDDFDKMLDMDPVVHKESTDDVEAGLDPYKRKIFKDLLELRDVFIDELANRDDLGIYEYEDAPIISDSEKDELTDSVSLMTDELDSHAQVDPSPKDQVEENQEKPTIQRLPQTEQSN